MNKNIFYEALYTSLQGVIVPKRRSVILPSIILLLSIIFFCLQSSFASNAGQSTSLSSLCLVLSIFFLLASAIIFINRLSGKGAPYYVRGNCFLQESILRLGNNTLKEVQKVLEEKDYDGLLTMNIAATSPLSCIVVSNPDHSFVACMLFSYSDLEYKQASELVVLRQP